MKVIKCRASGKTASFDAQSCRERAARHVSPVTKAVASIVVGAMGALVQGCQSHPVVVELPPLPSAQEVSPEPTPEQLAAEARQQLLLAENAFTHDTGMLAESACERFIRRRLRDPDSVRFPTEPESASVKHHVDGAYRAMLEIRAIDAADGTTISLFECEVVKVSDDWMLARLSEHPSCASTSEAAADPDTRNGRRDSCSDGLH